MKGYFFAKKSLFLFVPNVCDLRVVSCDKYNIYSNFTCDCSHIDDIICNNCNGLTSFFYLRVLVVTNIARDTIGRCPVKETTKCDLTNRT